MGPRLIMNGIKPSMAHAKYQFGQYFQTHEESSNRMNERTLDAIYAGPIGNNAGGSMLSTSRQVNKSNEIGPPFFQQHNQ